MTAARPSSTAAAQRLAAANDRDHDDWRTKPARWRTRDDYLAEAKHRVITTRAKLARAKRQRADASTIAVAGTVADWWARELLRLERGSVL